MHDIKRSVTIHDFGQILSRRSGRLSLGLYHATETIMIITVPSADPLLSFVQELHSMHGGSII